MRIKNLALKMQIALNIVMLVIMLPLSVVVYFSLTNSIEKRVNRELINTTRLIQKTTNLFVESTVDNHLRAIAEKSESLLNYFYTLQKNGIFTYDEAFEQAGKIFLDPELGKIGKTGYLAGINSKGIFVLHPVAPGYDGSSSDVVKNALAQKEGIYKYMWANAGESQEREKISYLSYFEPWDILIFASSYTEEFEYLLDMSDLQSSLEEFQIGIDGVVMILDKNGDVIFHPSTSSKNLFNDSDGNVVNESLYEIALKAEKRPGQVIRDNYLGEVSQKKRQAGIIYDNNLGMYILTSIPEKEIYATAGKIRIIFIVGWLLAFLAMNIVISLVFRVLLSPLREVNRVVSLASDGDVSHLIEVKTADEIGGIAKQVNILIAKMQEILLRVKRDFDTINSSIQDLSSSSDEIMTTSNEQASAVKEIVSTMEDSDSLTKGIEKRITEVTRISEHARSIVTSGVSNVEESLTKMEEIKVSNNDTIAGIRSLGEKIEAIWDIVNIINSIADQTKIIAFNAELEASAAGEAGKNFQIVASEIRRLANSTVNSTSEIKNKINEIQHSSDRLITASEDGTNKIEEGGKLTETLHATFEEIMETSEISADSAKEISSAVSQQVIAFEQILLTLKQISEGINNFVVSTKSTSEITRNMKEMSNNMGKFMVSFKIGKSSASGSSKGTSPAGCPMIGGCAFFNNKMLNMPSSANMFKNTYCHGDYEECARYRVKQATGVAHETLMPNQDNDVDRLIREINNTK